MARRDLLALTDEALTQLATAGLVKRCRRDIDSGRAPVLAEGDDGVIEARFEDGALTRLKPGAALADASCSCPASGVCRHRVALVMAYRCEHASDDVTATPEFWDPGTLDADALEIALGPTARAELERLRAAPLVVRLDRASPPSAALPMATVRFLAPNDANYARCDCAQTTGCAHIVLAVEAFRASSGANETTLAAHAIDRSPDALREAGDALLEHLLREGTTAGMAAHALRLNRVRALAAEHDAAWFALAAEALGEQIAAYEGRSARYDEDEVLALAVEIYARPRAKGVAAMGFGELLETPMAKTRLVSLGARITVRGREFLARVGLADTDTGATMLVERSFAPAEGGAPFDPLSIPSRLVAPGMTLQTLARGQALTAVAKRRADGSVSFGSGAGGKTTLVPRGVVLDLPAPLVGTDPAGLKTQFAEEAPAFLQPRNRARALRVFNVTETLGQSWRPGVQIWRGAVRLDGYEAPLVLKRVYDAGAPYALDHLAAAFEGSRGSLRQVAGLASLENGELCCEPWSLACDELIVPDIDAGALGATLAPDSSQPASPLEAARRALASALHAGHDRYRNRAADVRKLCVELEAIGYAQLSRCFDAALVHPGSDFQNFAKAALLSSILCVED